MLESFEKEGGREKKNEGERERCDDCRGDGGHLLRLS